MLAAVFAGDRRVWRVAAIAAVPLVLLGAFYCVRERFYFTGTNSVEDVNYLPAPAHTPVCVPGLELPAQSAFVRLRVIVQTAQRPSLHLVLRVGAQAFASDLPASQVAAKRPSNADFPIPQTPDRPSAQPASLCLTSRQG